MFSKIFSYKMRCLFGFGILILIIIPTVFGYPRAIPLGLIYRENEVDSKDGAYMAIIRHNRNSTRVLFMLNEELGKIMHDPKNTLKTIKLTCQILRRGFFILMATGDFDTHAAYLSISNELNIPYINWALPVRNESGQFEVSIYPPMEETLADILYEKGWTDYVYLYTGDDGPFRSMLIDQYVQSKRYKPSRVLFERLPDPSDDMDMHDYFLKFKQRTGKNRTIIDTHGRTLRHVMTALRDLANNLSHMHFIFASYELNDAELQYFKSGKINITMLNIFRPWNNALRDLYSVWRRANASVFSGEKTPLSLKAALAYDSVYVAVAALNNILIKENPDAFHNNFRHGEFYNAKGMYKGIWCDATKDKENPHRMPPDKFEHGRRIARHLKQVGLKIFLPFFGDGMNLSAFSCA